MTVRTSISLTDQQDDFARSLVRGGRFSSLCNMGLTFWAVSECASGPKCEMP